MERVFVFLELEPRLHHAGMGSAIAMVLLVITLVFSIMNIRMLERGTEAQ